MRLNQLSDKSGARRPRKRLGRGIGSGLGKTSGRGHKGFKSRSGSRVKGFEGGQMPIYRRLPKFGFNNPTRKSFEIVNLDRLQAAIDSGKLQAGDVDEGALKKAGLVNGSKDGVRVLARGKISAKVNLNVTGASAPAINAIESAGGTVVVTAKKKTVQRKGGKKIKPLRKKDNDISFESDSLDVES